jgi:integrase
MAKKKDRGNGDGDVYPRKNKDGKIIGYRGSYWVQTAEGPNGPDGLKVADYLRRTTFERYEQNCRKHIIPTLGRVKLKDLTPTHVRGLYKEKLRSLSPRSVR